MQYRGALAFQSSETKRSREVLLFLYSVLKIIIILNTQYSQTSIFQIFNIASLRQSKVVTLVSVSSERSKAASGRQIIDYENLKIDN